MNIQEIAKLAGVSPATVSKVMNGNDGDIRASTRERVLQIISEHNYVPYSKFLNKKGLRQHIIGIILQEDSSDYEDLLHIIPTLASPTDYSTVVRTTRDNASVLHAIDVLYRLNPAGLILQLSEPLGVDVEDDHVFYIAPCAQDFTPSQRTFYYNKEDAGHMAADYLCSMGHKSISCILSSGDLPLLSGIQARLQHSSGAQLSYHEIVSDPAQLERALPVCINDDVTAIICASPSMVCQVAAYASKVGFRVPDDLSIISIGHHESPQTFFGGITTIEYPVKQMMDEALLQLLAHAQGEPLSHIQHFFSPTLVVRHSVAPPKIRKTGCHIVAVGSMNMDITLGVNSIPIDGETQIAQSILTLPGGKGANQAVGVGKLGGSVSLIGCLGTDSDGRILHKSLTDHGVNVDGVEFDSLSATGKAFIYIDQFGENTIVVHRGANAKLDTQHLHRYESLFAQSKYCLLSLEIPSNSVKETLHLCRKHGVEVLVKPSAVDTIDPAFFSYVDYFIPNERELQKVVPGTNSLEEKAKYLLDMGVKTVIVTLGKQGCYVQSKCLSGYFPASPFSAVDTTGGADSFISALAVCLSKGMDLPYSIGFANYAAGITVTRYGVQNALPDRSTIDIYKPDIEQAYQTYKEKHS